MTGWCLRTPTPEERQATNKWWLETVKQEKPISHTELVRRLRKLWVQCVKGG